MEKILEILGSNCKILLGLKYKLLKFRGHFTILKNNGDQNINFRGQEWKFGERI